MSEQQWRGASNVGDHVMFQQGLDLWMGSQLGKIVTIEPTADPTNPYYVVEATIPLTPDWKQFQTVSIQIEAQNGMTMPEMRELLTRWPVSAFEHRFKVLPEQTAEWLQLAI